MLESLISFQVAKLAKEKEFNLPTYDYYMGSGKLFTTGPTSNHNSLGISKEKYSAPTQSFLQKWLRDNHKKHIQITADYYFDGINWNYQILWPDESGLEGEEDVIEGNRGFDHYDGTGMYGDNGEYDSYEKALEAGLKHCLTLI